MRSECIRQVKIAFVAADIAAPSSTYTVITQKPVTKPAPPLQQAAQLAAEASASALRGAVP